MNCQGELGHLWETHNNSAVVLQTFCLQLPLLFPFNFSDLAAFSLVKLLFSLLNRPIILSLHRLLAVLDEYVHHFKFHSSANTSDHIEVSLTTPSVAVYALDYQMQTESVSNSSGVGGHLQILVPHNPLAGNIKRISAGTPPPNTTIFLLPSELCLRLPMCEDFSNTLHVRILTFFNSKLFPSTRSVQGSITSLSVGDGTVGNLSQPLAYWQNGQVRFVLTAWKLAVFFGANCILVLAACAVTYKLCVVVCVLCVHVSYENVWGDSRFWKQQITLEVMPMAHRNYNWHFLFQQTKVGTFFGVKCVAIISNQTSDDIKSGGANCSMIIYNLPEEFEHQQEKDESGAVALWASLS